MNIIANCLIEDVKLAWVLYTFYQVNFDYTEISFQPNYFFPHSFLACKGLPVFLVQ